MKSRLDEEFEALLSLEGSDLIRRVVRSVDKTIAKFELETEIEEQRDVRSTAVTDSEATSPEATESDTLPSCSD